MCVCVFSTSDSGYLTGVIFIDFMKASDLVELYLLLYNLYAVGLSQNTLLWFSCYLHNRKQCVLFQGSKSELFIQQRGVPLGPLLFSIFINDLPSICSKSSVQLYADDTVILLNLIYCKSKLPFIQILIP